MSLSDLVDYPLVISSRPHAMRMSVETALANVGGKISVAHEIESIPAIIDLVRQGFGKQRRCASAIGTFQVLEDDDGDL